MVMEQMTKKNNEWTIDLAQKHNQEMLSLLEKEIARSTSPISK
jgi:hypothetical protein